jgi:hypothetical protein
MKTTTGLAALVLGVAISIPCTLKMRECYERVKEVSSNMSYCPNCNLPDVSKQNEISNLSNKQGYSLLGSLGGMLISIYGLSNVFDNFKYNDHRNRRLRREENL